MGNRNDINSIFPELIRVSGDITYIPTRTENVYVVLNELDPDVCFPLPTNPPTTEYYESNLKTLTNLHKLKIFHTNYQLNQILDLKVLVQILYLKMKPFLENLFFHQLNLSLAYPRYHGHYEQTNMVYILFLFFFFQ